MHRAPNKLKYKGNFQVYRTFPFQWKPHKLIETQGLRPSKATFTFHFLGSERKNHM